MQNNFYFFKIILIFFFSINNIHGIINVSAKEQKSENTLEIIRDVELEEYTKKISSILLENTSINADELNYYFINSNEINAFVTSGNNLFINTELIIASEDYREYLSVIAHELSHILSGHVFRTKEEIRKLGERSLPVYLLGILGILGGAGDAGLATLMIGSASVQDSYRYYSRNQEAIADQVAIKMLCENNIDAEYFLEFLKKLERTISSTLQQTSYRSTHPLVSDRFTWIKSGLNQYNGCEHDEDKNLQKEFKLLKAKLFGFTHKKNETLATYSATSDVDKYAIAVARYFSGEQDKSIELLIELIDGNSSNPFFRELLGEIYFSKHQYESAIELQTKSMDLLKNPNDLSLMIIANYYIALDKNDSYLKSIKYLKQSIRIRPSNTYSWYLLAIAYAGTNNLALAQYATAERYYLLGDYQLAYQFVSKSLKDIEKNTTEWYRANDLLNIMLNKKEKDTR